MYNFKSIQKVPQANELIDVVFSRVQKKTATVVHKRYVISRIREFYMTKVKFCQGAFRERLVQILESFPKLDSIHPFYADLINVLYDRDHYKLALGQINVARQLIENIGKEYVKLLKFGDSLYRCKALKRAALGRMATLLKKQSASLGYLEEVRQHLSRFPSINPKTRTLLLTGYPNVGKSSFTNKVTRANVDVQPYAFTTKSLYIGHMDYKYLRWQVIDTPGILDHPLEERNIIEMQAITALAHLTCTVMFFMDISGQSEYSIQQQVSLFESIKPLFASKPLVIVASKCDVRTLEQLDNDEKQSIQQLLDKNPDVKLISLSNISEEGISAAKSYACDLLLERRVQTKVQSNKVSSIVNRIHVAQPQIRDNKVRGTFIPESIANKGLEVEMKDESGIPKTAKQMEDANGGAGVYNFNWRDHWQLENDEWKDDVIPQIFLGKNVADYIDPNIEERLDALEKEEAAILAQIKEDKDIYGEDDDELDKGHKELARQIRQKKAVLKEFKRVNSSASRAAIPRPRRKDRTTANLAQHLTSMGLEKAADAAVASSLANSRRRGRSRTTKVLGKRGKRQNDDMDVDMIGDAKKKMRALSNWGVRSASRGRSTAFRDTDQQLKAEKLAKKKQKLMSRMARKGEGDRKIPTLKPKHLFSGKRGIGKTDWR